MGMTRASLILRGGKVASPSAPGGFAESIAVSEGRVLAVGTNDEIDALGDASTRVVDLAGRLALPAFGDAHVHAVSAGLESLRCNLLGLRTRQECLDRIDLYAAGLPADAWVLGGGWAMEAFPGGVPSAADLDSVCGGRPAFLPNKDHHSAWVNTLALEQGGIDSTTPDPFAGRIERDGQGNAVGALHDSAMGLVARVLPPTSPEDLTNGLRAALKRLHGHGITHWQDACVGDAGELGIHDTFDAYLTGEREGWLTGRVRAALWWDRSKGIEQLERFRTRREVASKGAFRATSVKMMVDGVCETFTAAMSKAYFGDPGHQGTHRGDLFIDPEVLNDATRTLDAEGFQVHFHAIGDRAVTTALDAIEGVGEQRWGLNRHHIAHLQFIAPGDLGRFSRIGAIGNFQPLWACNDPQMENLTIPFVGEKRSGWQYSILSLLERNARIAFGSDWPVSSPDPLQEMHVAVNRMLSTALGRPGTDETAKPFRPDQGLSVQQAVDAFTKGVAYVNGDEDILGVLEVGHQADIAVLSHDIFSIPTSEIGYTSVDLTVARGAIVHGDE
jgi:predicted amidohydrolase YtcJ